MRDEHHHHHHDHDHDHRHDHDHDHHHDHRHRHHPDDPERRRRRTTGSIRDRGQATTEYALVLLAAALVGVLVIGWATAGGGAAAIGRLFDSVIDAVIDEV